VRNDVKKVENEGTRREEDKDPEQIVSRLNGGVESDFAIERQGRKRGRAKDNVREEQIPCYLN
jgi:hypothetical protein